MKQAVLILGGGSEIARGAAAAWARRGYPLVLAGRDADDLTRTTTDLHIRFGIAAQHLLFDALDHSTYGVLEQAVKSAGPLAGVLIAFGDGGDQRLSEKDTAEALRIMEINFTAAAALTLRAGAYFAPLRQGFIIGISSVAGDRGRQSNFVYGASKGGYSLFLQGLRNRLAREGVHVMTVKPGFVDTAMTFGMPKLFAVASPEVIGEHLVAAQERGADVVYLPWFWRWIMGIIKAIPEPIFKKLSL